ncbi:MAG: alanine/ornithine racemase family PLP-dependent enzyme, partial [Clostridiales bacterium]|nr:alanine/ornithine racemase family PLP-dependent enzyme [Clostridiales bacterium]
MYPQLVIDLAKLRHNAREVAKRCEECGIELCGVVKGFRADLRMVKGFIEGGVRQIGTSRLSQIKDMKAAGIELPFVLLRISQHCEAAQTVELADYSLQSELSVMELLNEEARKAGKSHKVIVMAELGDLREGYWDREEMIAACLRVEKELRFLRLAGVGVNLGCYGSIKPTPEKMTELLDIAREVQDGIGRELEIVSGGATS